MKIELEKMLKPDFWTSINPDLHVDDQAFIKNQKALQLSTDKLKWINDYINEEGYFQIEPQDLGLPISKMADAVTKFADMGWPTPMVFVYDEFFILPYCISNILKSILGNDFKQLPDFWAWYVDPVRGDSGWKPHRDKGMDSLTDEHKPKSMTIWIPLSNATPQNGCMYLLPMNQDPYFIDQNNKNFDYQNIRALPVAPGAVLGWNQAVLHWGGRGTKRALNPRISVGFEFQRGDVPPFNKPLISVEPLSSLKSRLPLIGKQILQYKHMYPLTKEFSELAMQMVDVSK